MDAASFDDLLETSLETPIKKNLDPLLAKLAAAGNPIPQKTADSLNLLWEKWGEDELTVDQGEFCIEVANLPLPAPESPLFRKLLPAATRTVLPPYLTRNPIMKTLGVRDENTPLAEFTRRLHKLSGMKNGSVIFLPGSGRWGTVGAIDNINATVSVGPFAHVGNSSAIPLEIILRDAIVFTAGPELVKLVDARMPISSAEFRSIVSKRTPVQPSDEEMQQMALAGCARLMREKGQFAQYWNATAAAAPTGLRRSCHGRSLKEIDILLTGEAKAHQKLTEEETAAFQDFFLHLKPDTARRDAALLASCLSRIFPRASVEQMKRICEPLLGKAPFWPKDPLTASLNELNVWGELPAKNPEQLAAATAAICPEDYLAKSAMRLPLKSLNSVLNAVGDELIYDTFYDHKFCSADLLMSAWRNRKKRTGEELLKLVNVHNVSRALSQDNLPREWGTAMRELRTLFMDDEDFQKQLIDA